MNGMKLSLDLPFNVLSGFVWAAAPRLNNQKLKAYSFFMD